MKRAGVLSCAYLLAVSCGPQEGTTHPIGGNGVPDGGYGASCLSPPKDSDGDGISDHDEGGDLKPPRDSDGDGTPDYLDADGIPDLNDGAVDTDGDLIPNYRDLDSDGDCIPDKIEGLADSDGDQVPDFVDTDSDNDGLTDGKEDKNCNGLLDACESDRK